MKYTPAQLGETIRKVRRGLGVTQKDLALTSGTGLRFVIDLEKGKETCQIGKTLRVLQTLGIRITLTPPPTASSEARRKRRRMARSSMSISSTISSATSFRTTEDNDFRVCGDMAEQTGAVPLSHSLPLRPKRFRNKECRGYFAGILPEQAKREIIARNLGISARNDYAMLEQIGGECAGAVTFMPAGQPLPERDYEYRPLTQEELAGIIRELPTRPLLAGEKGIRLSLAGAQDKVAVRIEGDKVCLPLGNAPSTHILKPAVARFEGLSSTRRSA